jgi:hypothetical protein
VRVSVAKDQGSSGSVILAESPAHALKVAEEPRN